MEKKSMTHHNRQRLRVGFRLVLILLILIALFVAIRQIGWLPRVNAPQAPTAIPVGQGSPAQVAPGMLAPPESLYLPSGFAVGVYADGLQDPRMLALGPDEQLYVAERGAGRIVRLPDWDNDGTMDGLEVVAAELNSPSSIAFYQDGSLYVGETRRVLRLSEPDASGSFQNREIIIADLPEGGHHTRTVLFNPDWSKLYVSVGSSCNICMEEDARRAAILQYNPDGSGEEIFASGLRNAVGITFRPGTNELWATNNGRDLLGDNQPPETIYLVEQGFDYGWPFCHAGRIIDPDMGSDGACEGVGDPIIEMQAHSAPLGLAFYNGNQFPEEYQGDLFVAFHGSWNRSVPTGYKVVRIPMQNGQPGAVEDFAVGWLQQGRANWGRPVDVITGSDGGLYLSDDSSGRIYRIIYLGD
jgi:glucose/arabinose dehydrogenase